jgi:hypothetical protein
MERLKGTGIIIDFILISCLLAYKLKGVYLPLQKSN